jgi:hypothetical protein
MLAPNQQPVIDNFPLVATARMEFQERRALVFQFVKEAQRVTSGGCPALD